MASCADYLLKEFNIDENIIFYFNINNLCFKFKDMTYTNINGYHVINFLRLSISDIKNIANIKYDFIKYLLTKINKKFNVYEFNNMHIDSLRVNTTILFMDLLF